jgi:hypothetical protein
VSGFIQFTDGNWSYSTWITHVVFDLLVDRLPEGDLKAEIAELRDENINMLDLRDPAQETLVKIVVDDLDDYLSTHFDADLRERMKAGFTELHQLAAAQHARNQAVA